MNQLKSAGICWNGDGMWRMARKCTESDRINAKWLTPYENSSDLLRMKPQGFNQPEMAPNLLRMVMLVPHCSGSCRNAMDWLRLIKMGWNVEIGLEIGSAGPIWIRLLFVSPDPTVIWLCFNHKKQVHISTCWNAPPIHNRCRIC